MTTVEKSLRRMEKSLTMVSSKMAGAIPPDLEKSVLGMVFLRKAPEGNQSFKTFGVFMKRGNFSDAWGNPVALHVEEGSIHISHTPTKLPDVADIVLLICDPKTVQTIELYGQVGLDDAKEWTESSINQVRCGPVIGGDDRTVMEFVSNASDNETFLSATTFAYALSNGKMQGAHFSNVVLQVRESSNLKFYSTRAATVAAIINQDLTPASSYKKKLIQDAQFSLQRLLDQSRPVNTNSAAFQLATRHGNQDGRAAADSLNSDQNLSSSERHSELGYSSGRSECSGSLSSLENLTLMEKKGFHEPPMVPEHDELVVGGRERTLSFDFQI